MATGFQDLSSLSDCRQSDERQPDVQNILDDSSTTSSVYLGSEDEDEVGEEAWKTSDENNSQMSDKPSEKKRETHLQTSITINADVVKFIDKRNKFKQELIKQLQRIHGEVSLMPKEGRIKVTKEQGTIDIKAWRKQCCTTVRKFCARFTKHNFDLEDSSSVRKSLPKLGRLLRQTTAAYWIESNNKLAVMSEQSERNQVLKKVNEFLQSTDGFQECKRKSRSDQSDWRKPPEYDATRNMVIVGETNSFSILNDEARFQPVEEARTSKQLQAMVKIDTNITKFLVKRTKYFDELQSQLFQLGAVIQLKPGSMKIKKVDSSYIENWERKCEDKVNVFCRGFQKQFFPLDESIRESISGTLSSLEQDVSSTGAACWFDKLTKNLILVCPMTELTTVVKKVEEFIRKVGIFAKRSFHVEGSIYALVEKDLITLKEALKSCNVTLEKETLVVVCLKTEVGNVEKKVERFLQDFRRTKQTDAKNKVQRPRMRSLPSVSDDFKTDESSGRNFGNWRNKNDAERRTSRGEVTHSTTPRPRPVKQEPISVKINNDIVKFVMNNPTFTQELSEQLEQLNGEIQWKVGIPFVTIVHKSEDIFVSNWSEKCKSFVTKFFQRFRKESYEIQGDIQDSVSKGLNEGLKEKISSFGADCWLASSNRWLVFVCLKENLQSVVKVVEAFLQSVKEENEMLKEIIKFVAVSTDHVDYLENTQFLETLKESFPGLTEATFTEAKNQIRLKGSDAVVTTAKQECENVIRTLHSSELNLPTETVNFVSQDKGMDFIEKCLSEREIVSVIVVESKSSVKIIAKSPQECEAVKQCLYNNIHEATINLPSQSEHIFTSKKWCDISKTIQSEGLIDYHISFTEDRIKRDIKLHGATPLVKRYDKILTDFVNSQKIESCEMPVSPGIARYMREKLQKEIDKIEAEFREEQVKIEIGTNKLTCTGTKEGINESKSRTMVLRDDICTRSKDYSLVGIDKLFSDENGQRNIKGIEAESNLKIEVVKVAVDVEKESAIDVEAIQADRSKEKENVQVPAAPADPFDQCNFTTREGLKVSWKYGNIEKERADILVSSAVSNLNKPTMVGRVLNSVGGPSYMAACSQHTSIGTGDIATTTGGNLSCNYVIHAVCCDWSTRAEQVLRGLLFKILQECTGLSGSSLAMPLIGTGNHKFPEDVVLRVMREEFEKFSSMYPRGSLKEIKLVRYDQGVRRKVFPMQATSGISDSTRASSKPSTFVSLVAGSCVAKLKLVFYARSEKEISSAFVEIERFIEENITSKKVEHEKLFDVMLKHWNELERLAKDNDLRIKCVNDTTVSIDGLLSKVVEAKDKITQLASLYTDEERKSRQLNYISQNKIQWYYSDHSNKEVAYSAQLNGIIEVARMDGKTVVDITESDGQQYDIDFSQMIARNRSTGQTRTLSRKLIGSKTESELSLPSNWTPQPANQVVQLVRIAQSSPEYSEISRHFVAQGGRADQLHMIERIQNPRLYSMYSTFKKSMRGQVNEKRLFHGTNAANIDSINAHNFSRSFAGVNGTAYGNGVYFARDASYSIKYAKPQFSGSYRKMYVAKVLVGEYTTGVSGMKAPPSKNDPNNPGLRYDSVVNNVNNPTMYIIFQDNQYYPEYLLSLQ